MNKRQRKKQWKRVTPKEKQHCERCGRKLNFDDPYQMKWGTCDFICYGILVGVY